LSADDPSKVRDIVIMWGAVVVLTLIAWLTMRD